MLTATGRDTDEAVFSADDIAPAARALAHPPLPEVDADEAAPPLPRKTADELAQDFKDLLLEKVLHWGPPVPRCCMPVRWVFSTQTYLLTRASSGAP